jgi:hypothetical protein
MGFAFPEGPLAAGYLRPVSLSGTQPLGLFLSVELRGLCTVLIANFLRLSHQPQINRVQSATLLLDIAPDGRAQVAEDCLKILSRYRTLIIGLCPFAVRGMSSSKV